VTAREVGRNLQQEDASWKQEQGLYKSQTKESSKIGFVSLHKRRTDVFKFQFSYSGFR
jgi:hypothetical protein